MTSIVRIMLFIFIALLLSIGSYLIFNSIGMEEYFLQKIRDLLTKFFNSENQVTMFQSNADYPQWDTKLLVYRTDIQPNGEFQYYTLKYLSYIPFIMYFSLGIAYMIATQKEIKKKLIRFFIGFILMLIFTYFMSGVIVHNLIYKIKDIANVTYNGFSHSMNNKIFDVFIEDGFEWVLIFPVIFWIISMVRFKDFGIELPKLNNAEKVKNEAKIKKTREQRLEEKRTRKKKN